MQAHQYNSEKNNTYENPYFTKKEYSVKAQNREEYLFFKGRKFAHYYYKANNH